MTAQICVQISVVSGEVSLTIVRMNTGLDKPVRLAVTNSLTEHQVFSLKVSTLDKDGPLADKADNCLLILIIPLLMFPTFWCWD